MITVIVSHDVRKRNNVLKYLQDTKWESNSVQAWDEYEYQHVFVKRKPNLQPNLPTQWFIKKSLSDNLAKRLRHVTPNARHFNLSIFIAVPSIRSIPTWLLGDVDQFIILDKCSGRSEYILRREYLDMYESFPETPFMIEVPQCTITSLPAFPTRSEYYQGILTLLCDVLMPNIAENIIMSFVKLPPPPSSCGLAKKSEESFFL